MIHKRKNPRANKKNALKLGTNLGWCCGDTDADTACVYDLTVDVSSEVVISTITVGGTEYSFAESVSVSSSSPERVLLKLIDEIENALMDAGYNPDGVSVSLDAANDTIEILLGFSTGVINSAKVGSVQHAFGARKCASARTAMDKEVKGGVCGYNVDGETRSNGAYDLTIATSYDIKFNLSSNDTLTAAELIIGNDISASGTDLTSDIAAGTLSWTAAGTANDTGYIKLTGSHGCISYVPVKLVA